MTRIVISVLILISSSAYCQNSTDEQNSEMVKYFYNLPIDSCFSTILKKSSEIKLLSEVRRNEVEKSIGFSVNKPKNQSDSITIRIYHSLVAIGGSPNYESPMVYEQQAIKTNFFADSVNAFLFFQTQKTILDGMIHRFTPTEIEKANQQEIIYALPVEGNLETYQIHYSFVKENGLYMVKLRHIKTFSNDQCN